VTNPGFVTISEPRVQGARPTRVWTTRDRRSRRGDDDELGTLNHITDAVRLAAARAVRHGRSVSCGWEPP
jgi:hypothetical protein